MGKGEKKGIDKEEVRQMISVGSVVLLIAIAILLVVIVVVKLYCKHKIDDVDGIEGIVEKKELEKEKKL